MLKDWEIPILEVNWLHMLLKHRQQNSRICSYWPHQRLHQVKLHEQLSSYSKYNLVIQKIHKSVTIYPYIANSSRWGIFYCHCWSTLNNQNSFILYDMKNMYRNAAIDAIGKTESDSSPLSHFPNRHIMDFEASFPLPTPNFIQAKVQFSICRALLFPTILNWLPC